MTTTCTEPSAPKRARRHPQRFPNPQRKETFHSEAMKNIYHQVLMRLIEYLSPAQKASLQLLVQRLLVAAGGLEKIAGFKVLLVYGGGHDSANTLTCMRAAQLAIAARGPNTFSLRVVSPLHGGMTPTVLENIDRAYSGLMLHDDPRVELLTLDNGRMHPFHPQRTASASQRATERRDFLVLGHLSGGQARTTFFNPGHMEQAELYRQAISWTGGVDVVVGSLPQGKRKRFLAWGRRMLRETGLESQRPIEAYPLAMYHSYCQLHQHHRAQLLDEPGEEGLPAIPPLLRAPRFMRVDDLVHDPSEDHSLMLEHILGFCYDELAFGFNEAGWANPLLVAHLQGLRAEVMERRRYLDGVRHFLNSGAGPWRLPRLPLWLDGKVLQGGEDRWAAAQRRQLAAELASNAYNLSEMQLVCLLHAPFVEGGRWLRVYLERWHPAMLEAITPLHRALQGRRAPLAVLQWLETTSGLPLATLRMLYTRPFEGPPID